MPKLSSGILLAIIILTLAGCGGSDQTATPGASASSTATTGSIATDTPASASSPSATAAANTATSVPGSTEREVTYAGAGGVQLSGTLLLPAHAAGQKLPALLIVAGSGPTDRNGNSAVPGVPTLNTYKTFAETLAAHGIATLRYDKRAIGKSQKIPTPANPKTPTAADIQAAGDFTAWQNYVDDAAASLNYLEQQPEIDPARCGMLGHSEGGMLILQAAVQGKGFSNPPAVLILASSPGRPYDVLLREQIANLLKVQKATADQTKYYLDQMDRIITAIKQTGVIPNDVPRGLAALFPAYLGKFYQQSFQSDPSIYAAQYDGPVLILQGGNDANVFATEDAAALDTALKKRNPDDHELFIVPGLSHEYRPAKDLNDPGMTGDVDPRILDKLGSWAAGKLHAQ